MPICPKGEKCPEDVIGAAIAKKRGPRNKTVEAISGCDLPASGLSHSVVIWNAVVPPNSFARAWVKKRVLSLFSRHFSVLQKS